VRSTPSSTARNDDEAGVSNADVSLTTDDGDMTIALHTKADADGRYAFDGVRAGAQTVAASADGYLPSDASQFRLVENENLRRAGVRLHRGALANLEIGDGRGVPIAGATVVAALGNAIASRVAIAGIRVAGGVCRSCRRLIRDSPGDADRSRSAVDPHHSS